MKMEEVREEAVSLLNSAKLKTDTNERIKDTKQLMELLLHRQPGLLPEFLPHLLEMQMERAAAIRKLTAEVVEEVSAKHPQHAVTMVPVLVSLLHDSSQAVRKHVLLAGTLLYKSTLERLILQGLDTGQVDQSLGDSWRAVEQFKVAAFQVALQVGSDGVRLHALKFVESVVLLLSEDPAATQDVHVGLVGDRHPVLNLSDLSQEATRSLLFLLNLLKPPLVAGLSGPTAVVLLNILGSIGKQRAVYMGRVLPSLLDLAPSCEALSGAHSPSVLHALEKVLLAFLKSAHPNAAPEEVPSSGTKRPLPTPQQNGSHPKRPRAADASEQAPEAGPVSVTEKMVVMLGQLVEKGEVAMPAVDLLVSQMEPQLLADVVIAYLHHLPATCPTFPTPAEAPKKDSKRDPRRQVAVKVEPVDTDVKPEPAGSIPRMSDRSLTPLRPLKEEAVDPGPLPHAVLVPGGGGVTVFTLTPLVLSAAQQRVMRAGVYDRVLGAAEAVEGSGGCASRLRIGLLAKLAVEGGEREEALRRVREYVLEDYTGRQGHELCLALLYHLFAACTLPSPPASSPPSSPPSTALAVVKREEEDGVAVYTTFLLSIAEGLVRSLPHQDRSLQKLICDLPIVPPCVLHLLRVMIGLMPREGAEPPDSAALPSGGERVTQALTAVWILMKERPAMRTECLHMALECCVSPSEDVRNKAVRLVSNRLAQLPYLTSPIHAFAAQQLREVAGGKEEAEGHRRLALYFALCVKTPSLLPPLFHCYGSAPKAAKQAMLKHLPTLIKAVGGEAEEVLDLVENPPPGAEPFLIRTLNHLVEAKSPSPQLVARVKRLCARRPKEAEFLIPILSWLTREEVLPVFARLVDMSLPKFNAALARILQGSVDSGPPLTPTEVIIALHAIEPTRDSVPLKKVMEACSACLDQRSVFTQQVLAKALNQLVEHTPLPLLFMRTVLQAINHFPALIPFVMEILHRLVTKQIWKQPKLWEGFLKCAAQTGHHSFPVLLQLPAAQLEQALAKQPTLKPKLSAHAATAAVRPGVPRALLVVLGVEAEANKNGEKAEGTT